MAEALGVTHLRRTIGGVRGPVMIEDIVPGQEIELKGVEKGAGLAIGVTGTGTAIAIGQIGIETVGEQETEIQARPEKDIMTDEVCRILLMKLIYSYLMLFKDIETDTAPAPAHLFGMGIGTGLELHHLEGRREIAETMAKTTVRMQMASHIHRYDETRTRWSWTPQYRLKKMKWRR